MIKYAYWIFIAWVIIFALLFVAGFITFGHGLGDIAYVLVVVVVFILMLLLRYKILKERQNLIMEYVLLCAMVLFVSYIMLNLTLLRGPEYVWNGSFFYTIE